MGTPAYVASSSEAKVACAPRRVRLVSKVRCLVEDSALKL